MCSSDLTALGLLPSHQTQPRQPVPHPSASWPIHGPVIQTSSSNAPSPPGLKFPLRPASGNGNGNGASGPVGSPLNLNDPSIIFAQPAGRQLGLGGPGREGHWHNHLAQPGALVGNGTVGNSGTHRVNTGGHCFCLVLVRLFVLLG